MENKIKLICIDMDGTLLNNNHEISKENKEALKKARDLGVNIAITTGRLFNSARYYSDLIGINTAVIASNGAYINTNYNKKPLLEVPLSKDMIIKIYKIVSKYGLFPNFNSHNTVLRENPIEDTHAYYIMNKGLSGDKKIKFIVDADTFEKTLLEFKDNIYKCIVIEDGENKDNLWAAKKELKEIFGNKLHIVSSGNNNFEVMLGTVSKGNAVEFLAKELSISPSEVMCIGDSENDLSMIEFAGVGVAMANALDSVKATADYITDTNNNSGVAKAIEHFVLT